jgi:hypothetical protein
MPVISEMRSCRHEAAVSEIEGLEQAAMSELNRRDFLTVTAAGIAAAKAGLAEQTAQTGKPIRLGFIGIGGRGSYHLDCALGMEGVEVVAVCDIDDKALYRAKRWVEEAVSPPHGCTATARPPTRSCARRRPWIASFAALRGSTMRQSASPG